VAKTKRKIGQEILDGIRQLKRAEHGRVTNVPSVSSVREKTAVSAAGDIRSGQRCAPAEDCDMNCDVTPRKLPVVTPIDGVLGSSVDTSKPAIDRHRKTGH